MRRDLTPVLALASAWWLMSDLTSVWGPSLITIFGQAATTPPELMGAFALACVLASFVLVALTRKGGAGITLLAVALLARIVLAATPGGQVQLWAASIGFAAALGWFALLASRHGHSLAAGVATGWLLTSATAAAGGTWLPVWRTDAFGITSTVVLVLLALATCRAALTPTTPLGARQAWTVLPLGLVAGIAIVNAGRASTIMTDTGPVLLAVGCAIAALTVAALGRSLVRWGRIAAGAVAAALVIASLYGTWAPENLPMELAWWLTPLLVCAPVCLAVLLTPDWDGSDRTAPEQAPIADLSPLGEAGDRMADGVGPFAVLGGGVIWVLGFFAYYAGYDLGYRADLLLVVLITALVVAVAFRRPIPERTGGPAVALYGVVILALAAASIGAWQHRQPTEIARQTEAEVTVAAWNLRMGYGMDGRFDPEAVAAVVQDADVVLLSEIDRGWLLNGGQDQLAILAHLSGKRLYFAPAADPVWGDAVLTSLPVTEVHNTQLAPHGAVTGAQALAVRVRAAGRPLWVVSTHVQPTDTRTDGTIGQARQITRFASGLTRDGAGVVLAGDFNFLPDSPSFQTVLDGGFGDALAPHRPLPTYSASNPTKEIDHVFVTPDLKILSSGAWASEASDHLPVHVTVEVGK